MWELNTDLLSGRGFSLPDFTIRANIVRKSFESKRAWRRLITLDTTKTSSPSDTYLTTKALPTGFVKTLPRNTLKLMDANGGVIPYREIPFEQRLENKDVNSVFYIDHKNKVYGICGKVATTMTHNFFHTAYTTPLAAESDLWFFDDYAPYIPYEVAARFELGEDYDDINARNGNANAGISSGILRDAIKEDDSLQRSALGV